MKHFIIIIIIVLTTGLARAQKSDSYFENVQATWQLINTFYVDTVNEKALARKAIVSMLEQLDPHSVFIPSEDVQAMNEPLEGNFEGVGIQFTILKDTLTVVEAIVGGPSEKVGIMAGDRITMVDDENIASTGIKNSDVFKLLRGKKGTPVNLTIVRKGVNEPKKFRVVRDKIPIYSIGAAYMITPQTGYIKINRFSASTYEEFMAKLKVLKKSNAQNLILDLRGNGGGNMKAALDIVDEFLDAGKMMLYTQGNYLPRRDFNASRGGIWEKERIAVLIDEGSASASEIVAGAIQDWDRGVIMGRRSYGKGLVQRPFTLPDNSEIRLTIFKYYTPSGRSIQKPYAETTSGYHDEIFERMEKGELMNADSIHLENNLRLSTLRNKRVVYGGGGIMPDVFVPLDTSMITRFYRELYYMGTINQFTMRFIDENRADFVSRYVNFDKFDKDFAVDDNLFGQLVADAVNGGITLDDEQVNISEPFIRLQMKAIIASYLWGTNEYFRVINQSALVIGQAVELIEERGDYNRILAGLEDSYNDLAVD